MIPTAPAYSTSSNAMPKKKKTLLAVRQKRGVVFQSRIQVRSIPHKSELTARQKHSMWYTKNEYAFIKDSRKTAIAHMDRMSSILTRSSGDSGDDHDSDYDDDIFCSYGLHCTDEKVQRMTRVYQAQDALFQEQNLQWEEDISDPELLADVYFEATKLSQQEAAARANRLFKQLAKPPSRKDGEPTSKRAGLLRTKTEKRLVFFTKPAPVMTTIADISVATLVKKRSSLERNETRRALLITTKGEKWISSMKQETDVKKSLETESPSPSLVSQRQQRTSRKKKMVAGRAA